MVNWVHLLTVSIVPTTTHVEDGVFGMALLLSSSIQELPKLRGPNIDPNSRTFFVRTPTKRTPDAQKQPCNHAIQTIMAIRTAAENLLTCSRFTAGRAARNRNKNAIIKTALSVLPSRCGHHPPQNSPTRTR